MALVTSTAVRSVADGPATTERLRQSGRARAGSKQPARLTGEEASSTSSSTSTLSAPPAVSAAGYTSTYTSDLASLSSAGEGSVATGAPISADGQEQSNATDTNWNHATLWMTLGVTGFICLLCFGICKIKERRAAMAQRAADDVETGAAAASASASTDEHHDPSGTPTPAENASVVPSPAGAAPSGHSPAYKKLNRNATAVRPVTAEWTLKANSSWDPKSGPMAEQLKDYGLYSPPLAASAASLTT